MGKALGVQTKTFCKALADLIQERKKATFPAPHLGSLLPSGLCVRGSHLSAAGIWKTQSERGGKEAFSPQKPQLIRMMHRAANGY